MTTITIKKIPLLCKILDLFRKERCVFSCSTCDYKISAFDGDVIEIEEHKCPQKYTNFGAPKGKRSNPFK